VPVGGAYGARAGGEEGGRAGGGKFDFGNDGGHGWRAAGAAEGGHRERSGSRGGGVPDFCYNGKCHDDKLKPFEHPPLRARSFVAALRGRDGHQDATSAALPLPGTPPFSGALGSGAGGGAGGCRRGGSGSGAPQ